jgi:hypothetical protein
MNKIVMGVLVGACVMSTLSGCVVYSRPPRPPVVREEIVTVSPGPRAIWIKGGWVWHRGYHRYEWVPGHWRRGY